MTFQLNSKWTKNLKTDAGKKEFTEMYVQSLFVLTRLKDILGEEINNIETKMTMRKNYEYASWAYEQADLIGQLAALKNIEGLIKTLDKYE